MEINRLPRITMSRIYVANLKWAPQSDNKFYKWRFGCQVKDLGMPNNSIIRRFPSDYVNMHVPMEQLAKFLKEDVIVSHQPVWVDLKIETIVDIIRYVHKFSVSEIMWLDLEKTKEFWHDVLYCDLRKIWE